jgi:hypothetical protein
MNTVTLSAGERIGHYEVPALLGEGGMGVGDSQNPWADSGVRSDGR